MQDAKVEVEQTVHKMQRQQTSTVKFMRNTCRIWGFMLAFVCYIIVFDLIHFQNPWLRPFVLPSEELMLNSYRCYTAIFFQ